MERIDKNLPKNYDFEHRHRVYYPNFCNYCFSPENLLKCVSCKCVFYCSKEHQKKDWSFHKPTCIAMREIKSKVPFPENCDDHAFLNYRESILECLIRRRNFIYPSQLTEYERQICLLPWACPICFKKPSTNHECSKCYSVSYCSSEHLREDKTNHQMICWTWNLCRIFSSIRYENGPKVEMTESCKYQPLKRTIRHWPRDKLELIKLIQNDPVIDKGLDIYVPMNLFIDPYVPGAFIISALEMAGMIKKRYLTIASFDERRKTYQNPGNSKVANRRYLKTKTTLTIHFAIADDYEMEFEWTKIARILTDWIINIKKVRIVLIGRTLKEFILPSFENLDQRVQVSAHPKAYHEVENVPNPDVIIMLECDRAFGFQYHSQIENYLVRDSLFKYSDIPVILCEGHDEILEQIYDFLSQFSDFKSLVPIRPNSFTDAGFIRVWNTSGMEIYTRNNSFFVFTKR